MSDSNKGIIDLLLKTGLTICMAAAAWFTSEVWSGQQRISERLETLRINEAATNGNRFTSGDWVRASESINMQFNDHDKRISKLEDRYDAIKTGIDDIKKNLASKL